MQQFFKKNISETLIILITAAFLIIFCNKSFFHNIINIYPLNRHNFLFVVSLLVSFGCVTVILFSILCNKYTTKPVIILILLLSSFAAYFMDTYNVILDSTMLQNAAKTDISEASDLISFKLFLYFIFLGLLPSIFIYKVRIVYKTVRSEIISRVKLISVTLAVMITTILIFGSFYASFLREHKHLRFYSNPVYYLYSSVRYISDFVNTGNAKLKKIGLDAKARPADRKRRLIVFVVGEAAREDRFSVNGYNRETNPLLKKEDIISFTNFWSCGTSTAVSVPCMFSVYNRSSYSDKKARSTENILDVLNRVGVNILWLDNNSDSKGVALRVPHENYKTPKNNPVCDIECRDEGMLVKLPEYLKNHSSGDVLIILHQMGNHGPAYYKRYPASFNKFLPVCQTNQLESCSREELNNAYDNAILYTDYFLSKVIHFLKNNEDNFQTAMFYVSDHGESLGEFGVYLHGMPYFVAPEAQRHVASIMWFGKNFPGINFDSLKRKKNREYSQDNVFHTIAGMLGISAKEYDKQMDILHEEN